MEKVRYIQKLTKIFSEGTKHYWFNFPKYYEQLTSGRLSIKNIQTKMEAAGVKEIPDAKTLSRVLGYYEGRVEKKKKEGNMEYCTFTLKTAKALGMALCDDPYGLLIEVTENSIRRFYREADVIWNGDSVLQKVYRMMRKVLSELTESVYFNFQPGMQSEGGVYYSMRLDKIREEIEVLFMHQQQVKEKLYCLLAEIEDIIYSCEIPTAPQRWLEANPRILYFDVVYDCIEEDIELVESIKRGEIITEEGVTLRFRFYPTAEECLQRSDYFEMLEEKDKRRGLKASADRWYQEELIKTFSLIFEKEFE